MKRVLVALAAVAGFLGVAVATAATDPRPVSDLEYVIAEPGDSWWSIRAELGLSCTHTQLWAANGGGNLLAGQVVFIPRSCRVPAATTSTSSTTSTTRPSPTTSSTSTTVRPTTTTSSTSTSVPQPTNFPTIPSNFDRAPWLVTSGPPQPSADTAGNFRTFCSFSHLAYDDPIVYQDQPGASHLHMFFGNTTASAFSTYQTLRQTGGSTCEGGPLNRTGYWMPAMLNGASKVIVPDYFEIYYKGNGDFAGVQPFPNGLRMIAGFDMARTVPAWEQAEWRCIQGNNVTSQTTGRIPTCPAGATVKVSISFPMCWDGVNLDSANHRSHMSFFRINGGWFDPKLGCPATHPIHVPEITEHAVFRSDGNTAAWKLASDVMPGMTHTGGSTFHADWFGAWDPTAADSWLTRCIRGKLSCVAGELGDSTRLRDRQSYTGSKLLDQPPRAG